MDPKKITVGMIKDYDKLVLDIKYLGITTEVLLHKQHQTKLINMYNINIKLYNSKV